MAFPGYDIKDINTVFGFGKYNGFTALKVAKIQPSYFSWCAENLIHSSNAFYFSIEAYKEIRQKIPTFKLSQKAILSLAVFNEEWKNEYVKTYDLDIEDEINKLMLEISIKQDEKYAKLMIENERRNKIRIENLPTARIVINDIDEINNTPTCMIDFINSFFQDLYVKKIKESENQIDFKYFAHLKNIKHDEIIAFFHAHELGSSNPIMKYLNILAPIDRCIIIEQLFNPLILNSLYIRYKMVLYYVTADRLDLAEKIIEFSTVNGDIVLSIDLMKSKLNIGESPKFENWQRIEQMKKEFEKESGALERSFINLIIDFLYQS